jgi:hypothetical protein
VCEFSCIARILNVLHIRDDWSDSETDLLRRAADSDQVYECFRFECEAVS